MWVVLKELCVFVFFLSCVKTIEAKDFGKIGSTFEIIEESFVSLMQRKLSNLDIAKYQEEMINLAKEKIENPQALSNIEQTEIDREFYYDPTYILQEDVKLPNGDILHKAGAKVNPLEHMNFDRELVLIDGRKVEQVEWLKKYLDARNSNQTTRANELRVILTGGRIFDLRKELSIDLYFDQAGELTNRFGIKHVPAIVEAEDKQLRIREVCIEG